MLDVVDQLAWLAGLTHLAYQNLPPEQTKSVYMKEAAAPATCRADVKAGARPGGSVSQEQGRSGLCSAVQDSLSHELQRCKICCFAVGSCTCLRLHKLMQVLDYVQF